MSAPTIVSLAVIGDLFQGDRQVKLFSFMNSMITLSMAAAATLAGALLVLASQRRAGYRVGTEGAGTR